MKPLHLLIAILVSGFLYLLVFERDNLLDFAKSNAGAVDEDSEVQNNAETPDAEATPLVFVVAIHSTARTVDSAVMLRGRTEAARQVTVMAETSGKVVSEPLRKGAYIEAEQTLCQLDSGTRQSRLAEAKARLTEAEARLPEALANAAGAAAKLTEAKVNENAARRLNQQGYASETRAASAEAALQGALAGIESAKAAVVSAKAAIEAANAAIALIEKDIENLTITAPFAGLLETDTAELGVLLQPGSPCATIIQLDPIKLVGFAPETEVDKVTVGAMAGARLATGREVAGRVTFLSRSADPLTRTFRVEVQVPNAGLAIRDGQTVEIIVASDGTKAHLLPQSSLTLNNDGALGVRYVGPDNITGFAPVSILRDTPEGIWVAGLPDKVDVIVLGHEYVIAGVKVDVTYREAGQ
ncbi:efflux RND transporter periplasmic adaptor subunit [Profundibacter amoris]|uniref:HlyD family efflux transporter periplasmic adaptor subunit n=1 Tax=Profundibacter amoris TaxID=2171755 RepID=A0A347UFA7_9RHOB|nr:efflux RND transporter periplasmic adaptor subunit [Profundibacter amoris]AXX97535.1 HlyD family efflux transporter periplasmic adaptor subunit [Profundibacter amoris]